MFVQNVYLEKQKFDQKWIKLIFYFLLVLTFIISVLIFLKERGNMIAFIPFPLAVLLFLLFKKMELILVINNESICYQFVPFHSKLKTINKKDIINVSVDSYNPIGDYGGWGIRLGWKGKAYTTSGNFGIQLNITGNKNILIGTMNPKEVYKVLKEKGYNPCSNIFDNA